MYIPTLPLMKPRALWTLHGNLTEGVSGIRLGTMWAKVGREDIYEGRAGAALEEMSKNQTPRCDRKAIQAKSAWGGKASA